MKKLILAVILAAFVTSPAWAKPDDLFDVNSTTAAVISCTTTPSSVAFENSGAPNVMIYNAGTNAVFVTTGASTVTTTFPTSSSSAGTVIAPGAILSLKKEPTHTHIACDAASGTNAVYVSSSKGE